MATLQYAITFFSYWHTGSGLTSGADMDALVIKDKNNLPYIPGKTLKGLLKGAAIDLLELKNQRPEDDPFITEFFGYFDEKPMEESKIHTRGSAFFTNAQLALPLRKTLTGPDSTLKPFLYRSIASTAIGEEGVAKKGSLRKIEVTVPLTLFAAIYNINKEQAGRIEQCMKWIKRMGLNRTRGLGRCNFEIVKMEEI
jgi:CRISPR/Cas system CSM-associated protein Csm3 (group 7 of RAMP superfamily)